MTSCFNAGAGWPEPVVRVQAVSDTCGDTIPERYVKPLSVRPRLSPASDGVGGGGPNTPVVDLSMLDVDATSRAVVAACREWGFFQVVNHGVRPELLRSARAAWRGFFRQPAEVRERYANSPATYEGYGSRLGTAKGGPLDWGDYYFLHLLPPSLKSHEKWPSLPSSLRGTTEEYGEEVLQLCRRVMRLLSGGLGLEAGRLQAAFGGEGGEGACLRVNFYPRCPQPELTLAVAGHSDPGGMTMLLVDDHVKGLQVRSPDGQWIIVDPVPDAFIVNVGDQIQAAHRRCVSPHHSPYVSLQRGTDTNDDGPLGDNKYIGRSAAPNQTFSTKNDQQIDELLSIRRSRFDAAAYALWFWADSGHQWVGRCSEVSCLTSISKKLGFTQRRKQGWSQEQAQGQGCSAGSTGPGSAANGRNTPSCDWFRIMGPTVFHNDASCAVAAIIMCMEAQGRLYNEMYHGADSIFFRVQDKVVESIKSKCKSIEVWIPGLGAPTVVGVLDVIRSWGDGIPTVLDNTSLRLKGYYKHGKLDRQEVADLLQRQGPVVGALNTDDPSQKHCVVCSGYRFVGDELLIIIVDNLMMGDPVRFVLHEEFDEFYELTVETDAQA